MRHTEQSAMSGITDAVMMHLFHELKPITPASLSILDHQGNCKEITGLYEISSKLCYTTAYNESSTETMRQHGNNVKGRKALDG